MFKNRCPTTRFSLATQPTNQSTDENCLKLSLFSCFESMFVTSQCQFAIRFKSNSYKKEEKERKTKMKHMHIHIRPMCPEI